MGLRKKIATYAAAGAAVFAALTASAVASPVPASAAVPAESACPYSSTHPPLGYGDTGSAVRHAQCLLNIYGYRIAEDGMYGSATLNAVYDVQGRCGIDQIGGVDAITWNCLHPDKSPNPR